MRQLAMPPKKLRRQRKLLRWLTGWKNSFTEWVYPRNICPYNDEEYFRRQISEEHTPSSTQKRIEGKSLARHWNLTLPDGFGELGLQVFEPDPEDGDYRDEWWFFGELDSGEKSDTGMNKKTDLP